MAIEERELHFARHNPLVAWRLFRVRRDDDGPLLSSPMYHDRDEPLWPRPARTATCYKDHAAPAAGCRCGIYGAIRGTLDSLPGYLLDTAHDDDPWAYAEVACSGRVFVDLRGVRAERAELVRIALDEDCWLDEDALGEAGAALTTRYGVQVAGLSAAPDWLTTNLRSEGKPPEQATLDLDTLDFRPG